MYKNNLIGMSILLFGIPIIMTIFVFVEEISKYNNTTILSTMYSIIKDIFKIINIMIIAILKTIVKTSRILLKMIAKTDIKIRG